MSLTLTSDALKRKLAASANALIALIQGHSWVASLLPYLVGASGLTSIVALLHAIGTGSLLDHKLLSSASILQALSWLLKLSPSLSAQYGPLLSEISQILGVGGLTAAAVSKTA